MKLESENDFGPLTSGTRKKKVVIGMVVCVLVIGIWAADYCQQSRFGTLQHGYLAMEQHQYAEAAADFETYLGVDSELYWYLIEHLNNDESYSREKVREYLEECRTFQDVN